MDTGIATFPTHDSIQPGPLARLVEEHGHAALFFAEHTHIPASRESPWAGGRTLPRKYAHTYDLFVAMAASVAATSRLRVGSGICLVIERDPIITAKEVASLDCLSGGRIDFGVGAGWNREEMANHGTDARRRMAVLRERVEAMKAIWTQDEASYAGEHVAFERIWCWPKPVQRPHPPVLVGGNGPKVVDRVLAFGDGWIPMAFDLESLAAPIADLRTRASEQGRGDLPVTVCALAPTPENLARAEELGVARVLFAIDAASADDTARQLDDLTQVAAPYLHAG